MSVLLETVKFQNILGGTSQVWIQFTLTEVNNLEPIQNTDFLKNAYRFEGNLFWSGQVGVKRSLVKYVCIWKYMQNVLKMYSI